MLIAVVEKVAMIDSDQQSLADVARQQLPVTMTTKRTCMTLKCTTCNFYVLAHWQYNALFKYSIFKHQATHSCKPANYVIVHEYTA